MKLIILLVATITALQPISVIAQSRNIYGVNRTNNPSGIRNPGRSMLGGTRNNILRGATGTLGRRYFSSRSPGRSAGTPSRHATGTSSNLEYHPAPPPKNTQTSETESPFKEH